jgi:hypothetical protein
MWSMNGLAWQTPPYFSGNEHLGGSAFGWPENNVDADERLFLSFWGHSTRKGGADGKGWGQPFAMMYGVPTNTVAETERLVKEAVDTAEAAIATLISNLSNCTIELEATTSVLEAHRLARLAQADVDKAAVIDANASRASTTTAAAAVATTALVSPDPTEDDGTEASGSRGGGATAAGIVAAVLVLAVAIGGYTWHTSTKRQQRQQHARHAAVGGGVVVEMMENPLRTRINREYAPPAGLPPAMIYYSEPADPATTADSGAAYVTANEGGAVYASAESAPAEAYASPADVGAVYAGGSPTPEQEQAAYQHTVDMEGGANADIAIYTNDAYANLSGSTTNA